VAQSAFEVATSPNGTAIPGASAATDPQFILNAYFAEQSSYWAQIYEREGIKEAIHQDRLRAALAMVDTLHLPPDARVLDVGCGTGIATVALAVRGLTVDALDPCEAMVEATRKRAVAAKAQSRITTRLGDVHAMPFADNTFSLVVALGVLPWLPELGKPLWEMARVIRPGGHMVVNVDSLWQLRQALDPLRTALLQHPKKWLRDALRRWFGQSGARSYQTSIRALRLALAAEGFEILQGVALGFGPFTFFDREILPRSTGLKLHHRLQALANRSAPILRSTGSQYIVLAQKRDGAMTES
jgi:ubiquinone/menaquinone biosynthesis C-methylase UbiE